MFISLEDVDILARTVYGEARGEFAKTGIAALIAVANVIFNRGQRKTFWGGSIRDICLQPQQFSCWNVQDPNYILIKKIMRGEMLFDLCWDIAQNVLKEKWPDLTKGADHYHALSVAPFWALGKKPLLTLGHHVFYKLSKEVL
ncbi:MAG: cell wall hydrolase [Holosporales bacterium]|jgi:spore germination cell wall hydrolase CwlJ-like protein|nr:cell wall hydrolase [Holosporales bacterium]